jgi:hypothetical protein
MSTYILGFPGPAIVTNADGTVALVPGVPITSSTPDQALAASLHDE